MRNEGVTEALNASDRMERVRRRSSVYDRAGEVVPTEPVYA